MSDAPTPTNGGKWELMSYVQQVSSHLPPLGGVSASDMIDIGLYVKVLCAIFLKDRKGGTKVVRILPLS